MNKAELVKAMAERTGQSMNASEKSLNAFISIVEEQVGKGNAVSLVGFGSFASKQRAEREGRNPQSGEKITIPARLVPVFKPGSDLKKAVL